jgi:hypothetical protein
LHKCKAQKPQVALALNILITRPKRFD